LRAEDIFARVITIPPREIYVRDHSLRSPSYVEAASGVLSDGAALYLTFSFYEEGPKGLLRARAPWPPQPPVAGYIIDYGDVNSPAAAKFGGGELVLYSKGKGLRYFFVKGKTVLVGSVEAPACASATLVSGKVLCLREGEVVILELLGLEKLDLRCEGVCEGPGLAAKGGRSLFEVRGARGISGVLHVEGLHVFAINHEGGVILAAFDEGLRTYRSPGFVMVPITWEELLGRRSSVEVGSLLREGNEVSALYVAGGSTLGVAKTDLSALLEVLLPYP